MDPALAVLATQLKQRLLKTAARLALLVLPVLLVGGLTVALFASTLLAGDPAGDDSAPATCTSITRPTAARDVATLDGDQLANAQTIVAVGRRLEVPAQGWVIALSAALQESTLRNLTFGDRDSLGLFQQRDAWGSRTERLDPVTAATMFFTGGRGGQRGLLHIPSYLAMPVAAAAQAVQVSAFPDAYAKWERLARQLAGSPSVADASCQGTVDGSVGAKVVTAAQSQLGVPYSWGGGGIGGPTLGFGRGAGTVGFDCSSFAQYAWYHAAGITLPRVATDQAAALQPVPLDQLRAGDLLFFHARGDPAGVYHHVGIYDGNGGMIHSPRTGKTVERVTGVFSAGFFGGELEHAARPA
jgi:cell wall-associated NlpC family hydrolase